MGFGQVNKVPNGCASVRVNKQMGRVEKMMIKQDFGKLMDGDVVAPTKIIPWFTEGIWLHIWASYNGLLLS